MKLIDKDAVVAEIEKRKTDIKAYCILEGHDRRFDVVPEQLAQILSFLNTLEVKEVDLEDTKKEELAQEYVNYTFNRFDIDPKSKEAQLIYYAYMHGINQCLTQLRAYKGE